MSLWQGLRATFVGKNNYTPGLIGDREVRFHKMSFRLIMRLPRIGEPLLNAFLDLYTMHTGETSIKRTQYGPDPRLAEGIAPVSGPSSVPTGHEEINSPPDLEFANAREAKRKAAIKVLMDGLSSVEVRTFLGEIVQDALYEVFPPGDKDNPPPLEVVESIGLEPLIDCLKGIYEANKVVLAPLARRVKGRLALEGADEGLREALEQILQRPRAEQGAEQPSLETAGAPSS